VPRTHGGLWLDIVDWSNLLCAYYEARRGKRYNPEVLRFEEHLEENITNIQNHLIWHTWQPGPWREFWVYDPKSRLIQAPQFEDRVVHHALVDVVGPLFERKMVKDSCACRRDKGTHYAVTQVQRQLRIAKRNWDRVYVLQADISKYFPSISHDILLRILSRTIQDKDALWLCEQIIRLYRYSGCGIPVGALTSQLFANVYLDQLDHKIKDAWGVKHYVRYMDDFVILGKSKKELWELLTRVEKYLAKELQLELNPKTRIYPANNQMINFAGYRICATHMLPRKRNIKRARQQFRQMSQRFAHGEIGFDYVEPRVMSFLGYVKHCNAWKTTSSALTELRLSRNKQFC